MYLKYIRCISVKKKRCLLPHELQYIFINPRLRTILASLHPIENKNTTKRLIPTSYIK